MFANKSHIERKHIHTKTFKNILRSGYCTKVPVFRPIDVFVCKYTLTSTKGERDSLFNYSD